MRDTGRITAFIANQLRRVPWRDRALFRAYTWGWHFINYGLVCGIGVMFNFGVWGLLELLLALPWFINNACAILVAMTWNYEMTVGHWGYLWGFEKRKH